MIFWCVKHKHFDGGTIRTWCYEVKADTKPINGKANNKLCEEYRDYFENYDEAKDFEKSLTKLVKSKPPFSP